MASTEELMVQYGVAWFGFDEASGNVYDKLGSNYVGTVTGATRVDGWNGEGKAIKCGGTSKYVTFNNSVIPIQEFTIRFKIKALANIATAYFIGTANNHTSSYRGLWTSIQSDGALMFGYWNATGSVDMVESKSVADGLWHDVMIIRNSSRTELYIDNKLESWVTNTVATIAHSNNLSLLNISAYYATAGRWLNGQIDDLQIYSKALTPSDFTQQRVAIKTADNKNLVLPNREGRVKEIPSLEETDLIKQGYTWREIDKAVDGGMDLTQTTTEYEVVSKSQTILGNGKMFTIPLDDFKTIKIEDNY